MTAARRSRKQVAATGINRGLIAATGVAAMAGAAFYFRNELMAVFGFEKTLFAPHVKANLPIAKDLPTVGDNEGNYDIDGVSFDTEGVVVGSDRSHESKPQNQSDIEFRH